MLEYWQIPSRRSIAHADWKFCKALIRDQIRQRPVPVVRFLDFHNPGTAISRMAPLPAARAESNWDANTTINFVALIVAVPGAVAGIVTLWILHKGHHLRFRGS